MHIKHPLTGAMVALITPMFEDGSVDFDALANLVEYFKVE
jgi:4-hydroxy-tetrahydrodipicolinate synthase